MFSPGESLHYIQASSNKKAGHIGAKLKNPETDFFSLDMIEEK